MIGWRDSQVRQRSWLRVCAPVVALVSPLLLAATAWALSERYHTYDEVWTELQAVADAYPSITALDTLGFSTQDGRDIWALKLSDNPHVDEDEPVILYDGIHHAEEVLGLEAIMWMIDELTSAYGVNDTMTRWIDDCEIWFIPILNPDGHAIVTAETDTTWRKNTRDNNENGHLDDQDGVDINRNYDFNWELGGTDTLRSPYYRGPGPFSESETRVMRDFCLGHRPLFALNYHSPRHSDGDLVYFPWVWPGHGGVAPDHHVIYSVASELCARTVTEEGVPFTPVIGEAEKGKAANWQYGVAGTIGLTMEILSHLCLPSGSRVDAICEKVSSGSYCLLERAYGPGITGHVTDASTGLPLVAEVKVVENHSDDLTPRTTDAAYGRYWRLLTAGSYTVEFSCFGYEPVTVSDVSVGSEDYTVLDAALEPIRTRFAQIFPNPTADSTTVSFTAPPGGTATVEIYSVAGRLVATLEAGVGDDGRGAVSWDGKEGGGEAVASGIYFARLVTESGTDQAKISLVR